MSLIANLVDAAWASAMAELARLLAANRTHPARTVVLLPYAQLIGPARAAWADQVARESAGVASGSASFFMPRFETTMNWASALPGYVPLPEDIHQDAALDALTAASLLGRAGLGEQQKDLTGALVEAAGSLTRIAGAQPPGERLAWGAKMAVDMAANLPGPALAYESAVTRIALAWTAASSYPTDVLFSAQPDLLVVIDGFQSDSLSLALQTQLGQRAVSIPLQTPLVRGTLALHTAADLEDEAHLAAACVLAHLAAAQAGDTPVALVAQDRKLTRRVRAMLAEKGVAVRDETGWKLSTTRAAASVMGLLRAMPWDASTDAVLDWLKNASAFDVRAVTAAEKVLRKNSVRFWRSIPPTDPFESPELADVAGQVEQHRTALKAARPLADWVSELRNALQSAGQWVPLAADAAGQTVIAALHLATDAAWSINPQISLSDFSHWAHQSLEAASFTPPHPAAAQVVILPLSQLLGRKLAAVVLPGCDEQRLPVSPEPSGPWTPQQRLLLGLPSRQEMGLAQRAAWHYALTAPHLDVLWRTSEGGEVLMPSGFVQELQLQQLQLQQTVVMAADPRPQRSVLAEPTAPPLPTGSCCPSLSFRPAPMKTCAAARTAFLRCASSSCKRPTSWTTSWASVTLAIGCTCCSIPSIRS